MIEDPGQWKPSDDVPEWSQFLRWAVERSDDLRNAYSARGSILLAVAAAILGGTGLLLRQDVLKPVLEKPDVALWFWLVLAAILFLVARCVWHTLRATVSTFESRRDGVAYSGPERFLLSPEASFAGKAPSPFQALKQALFLARFEKLNGPGPDFKRRLQRTTSDSLNAALVGELWCDLAIQHRRYIRLCYALTSVGLAFALWLILYAIVLVARL